MARKRVSKKKPIPVSPGMQRAFDDDTRQQQERDARMQAALDADTKAEREIQAGPEGARTRILGGGTNVADATILQEDKIDQENINRQEVVDSSKENLQDIRFEIDELWQAAMAQGVDFGPLSDKLAAVADNLGQTRFTDEQLSERQRANEVGLAMRRDEDLDQARARSAGRGGVGGSALADAEAQISSGFRSNVSQANLTLEDQQRNFNADLDQFIGALRSGDLKAVAALQNQAQGIQGQLAAGHAGNLIGLTNTENALDFAGIDEVMDYAPTFEFNMSEKNRQELLDITAELEAQNNVGLLEGVINFLTAFSSTQPSAERVQGTLAAIRTLL